MVRHQSPEGSQGYTTVYHVSSTLVDKLLDVHPSCVCMGAVRTISTTSCFSIKSSRSHKAGSSSPRPNSIGPCKGQPFRQASSRRRLKGWQAVVDVHMRKLTADKAEDFVPSISCSPKIHTCHTVIDSISTLLSLTQCVGGDAQSLFEVVHSTAVTSGRCMNLHPAFWQKTTKRQVKGQVWVK